MLTVAVFGIYKTDTQHIVLFSQHYQGLFNLCGFDIPGDLDHKCLIPMVWIWPIPVEEGLLDRQQAKFPA
ncbi:hypothetical protein KS18_16495 [Photorhabdus luminescens]|nr:hypothetical protein KS18_16495 [Photorhabdus luminescens]